MSTSNRLVKTLSEINPDDLPTFSSLDNEITSNAATSGSSISDFFTNITWQTWLIIILILAFLGINIFSYLKQYFKMVHKNVLDLHNILEDFPITRAPFISCADE